MRRVAPAAALAALALAVPAAALGAAPAHVVPVQDPQDSSGGLDLRQASFVQKGGELDFDLATYAPWTAATLRGRAGRSLCVTLADRTTVRVCVAPQPHGGGLTLVRQTLGRGGAVVATQPLPGTATRAGKRAVRIAFGAADAGLAAGALAWQASSTWTDGGGCRTSAAPRCTDLLPDGARQRARLLPYVPVGCRPAGPSERLSGPRAGKRIALSFDDGPAPITSQFVDELEREHVPATFFMVGKNVAGRGPLIHRMLADGDMVGNHTWDHADIGSGGASAMFELKRTQAVIKQASGFTPCLFRPPYGSRSTPLETLARGLGLLTIVWNDDPQDWRTPGTPAIVSTVMSEARPGGIVLMHDGGGPRGQTLAALPQIVHALRARGYRLVTVSDLLGLKLVYR